MDALEIRRFCAFLLVVLGMMYIVGALSDSAVLWAVASTVAVLQLAFLFAERAYLTAQALLLFSIAFIPIATAIFLSLPQVREKVVVLTLIASNLKMLWSESFK